MNRESKGFTQLLPVGLFALSAGLIQPASGDTINHNVGPENQAISEPAHGMPSHVPPHAMQSRGVHGHFVVGKKLKVNGYRPGQPVVVMIDKKDHKTNVLQLQNNELVRVLTVSNAVGKHSTPTPPGRYLVSKKEMYPVWRPPADIKTKHKMVRPYNVDHKNPLGVARITLNKFKIALHGTNSPRSIQKNVSHGCIRHSNKDIKKLAGMVKRNTVVYICSNNCQGKVLQAKDFKEKHTKASKKGHFKKFALMSAKKIAFKTTSDSTGR